MPLFCQYTRGIADSKSAVYVGSPAKIVCVVILSLSFQRKTFDNMHYVHILTGQKRFYQNLNVLPGN